MRNFSFLLIFVFAFFCCSSAKAIESWTGTNGKAASSQLGQADFSGDVRNRNAGPPEDNNLYTPKGVAINVHSGKVYLVDTDNHRVLRYLSTTALQSGASAEAVFGQANFTTATPAAGRLGLNSPAGAVVDFAGNLWVSDTGNNRVVVYLNADSQLSGSALSTLLGQPDEDTTTSGTANNKLNSPRGLAADIQGNIWVADQGNHRVLFFDHPRTVDNIADMVLGQSTFTGTGFGPSASNMYNPADVALSSDGTTLWVADQNNNRVLRFDRADQKMNGAAADGLLGQTTFNTGTAGTTQSTFNMPESLDINSNGRLFVADSQNRRVLHFRNAATKANGAPADGVLGKSTFTDSSAENASATTLSQPVGVACDGVGRLWVADMPNNRVMRFQANENSARIASVRRQIKRQKRALKVAKKKKRKPAIKRAKRKIRSLNRVLAALLRP